MPFRKLLSCKEAHQPLAWWKQAFGREFPTVRPFLIACTGKRASFYPCPDDPAVCLEVRESGKAYRAIPTGTEADDYDDLELCWEDVQAHRLDRQACIEKGIISDDQEEAMSGATALIGKSCEKLSRQMEEGFEFIKKERIEDCVKLDTRQKVIAEMADGPEKFITGLRAQLSDKDAELFMLLIHKESDENGALKCLSFSEIGDRIGKSKQAAHQRTKKLEESHPKVWEFVESIRNPRKDTVFSGLSPSVRRGKGIDESYNYNKC